MDKHRTNPFGLQVHKCSALKSVSLLVFIYIFATKPLLINCTRPIGSRRLPPMQDRFSCSGDLPPRYFPLPRRGDNGFRLKIEGEPKVYEPLQQYTVTLQSSLPAIFRGFSIRSTMEDGSPAGEFSSMNSHTSRIMTSCTNVVTHKIGGKKTRIQAGWRAPSSGCVRISASVIQKGVIWFKDEQRLSFVICHRNTTALSSGPIRCCACGGATYRMTFYGLWSPTSHPKDYPAFSTHWSNIIGASHSPEYVIWEYGGYASEGVQKVAEWGWPGNLETEIRSQRDVDVLSVVKTKAQWPAYQPRNLREAPFDEFSVDSSRHLVSLVTMLGPSPDWNVGLSKESMCTEACGWAGTRTYNLTPWDAGTDSGVSYMSPNSPTNPHDKIRPLTSSDHPESPFFNEDGEPIPPVARIVIRRLSLTGEQCGESEATEDTDDVELTSVREQATGPACMYSEWGEWSACGVTCGWGIKTRNRMVKFNAGSAACESTMEKEICQGSGQCDSQSDVTECLYSDWTSWSECSASCGRSLRFKSRVLQWPSEPRNCHEPLKEMSDCDVPACACEYSPWSDWMSCPVTCGVGQTIRKRAVQSQDLTCTETVMQTTRCMVSMSCESEFRDTPGCVYSPWSDWSACPVTCGVGQAFRKRTLVSSDDTSCRSFYMENSKCMTSATCDVTCRYDEWSEWMPCSASCGDGTTLRKRFLSEENVAETCEDFVMETASCHHPPCDEQSEPECHFTPWIAWMPCSVTCGKGETFRKRFLNRTSSSSDCQDFEMETNICMVTCDVTATSSGCLYSDWTPWTPCHQSCESSRERSLLRSLSERRCDRVAIETKVCSSLRCQGTDGGLSLCDTLPWEQWSDCLSSKCGKIGQRRRRRELMQQATPIKCSKPRLKQRERCQAKKCGRDCVMTSWSNWTSCECSSARGRRKQTRRRRIRTRPRRGGRPCGKRVEKRHCLCT